VGAEPDGTSSSQLPHLPRHPWTCASQPHPPPPGAGESPPPAAVVTTPMPPPPRRRYTTRRRCPVATPDRRQDRLARRRRRRNWPASGRGRGGCSAGTSMEHVSYPFLLYCVANFFSRFFTNKLFFFLFKCTILKIFVISRA